MKNDALTEDTVTCEGLEIDGAAEDLPDALKEKENEPVAALSERVEQLEERLSESERARTEQSEELRRFIDEINRANRESSAGSVKGAQSDYFSFSEVKEMTPEEVRKNFTRIIDSMGKWN